MRPDLNWKPSPYEGDAPPIELRTNVVDVVRFELTTPCFRGRYADQAALHVVGGTVLHIHSLAFVSDACDVNASIDDVSDTTVQNSLVDCPNDHRNSDVLLRYLIHRRSHNIVYDVASIPHYACCQRQV